MARIIKTPERIHLKPPNRKRADKSRKSSNPKKINYKAFVSLHCGLG